ncbi:hypothetical protein [Xanthobacter autotrophicus]|uniref:hypothetical protein n=1 Tax=Xanthobacter autotrophicus TaxID=280 RepID=UPI00372B5885
MRKIAMRQSNVYALAFAIAMTASPVAALDPVPKGYREKQRHDFRDVQLGLSHPSRSDRGMPKTGARPQTGARPPSASVGEAHEADVSWKRTPQ